MENPQNSSKTFSSSLLLSLPTEKIIKKTFYTFSSCEIEVETFSGDEK